VAVATQGDGGMERAERSVVDIQL